MRSIERSFIGVIMVSILFALTLTANASAASNWYQPAGTVSFEYTNGSNTAADFSALEKDRYFGTLDACNKYIAAQNKLIPDGTSAPNGGNNIAQHADGICHAVLPYQVYGWHALGSQILHQSGKVGKSVPLDIGPFASADDCEDAISDQKGLTIQNGPVSKLNIGYVPLAVCIYTY